MSTEAPVPNDCEPLAALRTYLLGVAREVVVDRLRPKASESDFVQQALLDAHQKREQFRGTSLEAYRGWVRSILLNRMRNWYRDYHDPAREVHLDEAAAPSLADDAPLAVLLDEERIRGLAAAVAALSVEYREVLAHRFEHNRTFAEIGALMGRSDDAARMLLHRALTDLRGLLRPLHD